MHSMYLEYADYTYIYDDEEISLYDGNGNPTSHTYTIVDEDWVDGVYHQTQWQVEMKDIDVLEDHRSRKGREISYEDYMKHYAEWYPLNQTWDLTHD